MEEAENPGKSRQNKIRSLFMNNQQLNQQSEELTQQSYHQPQQAYIPQPNSHLGLAIFTTLCCCLPFGIVAIIKGNNVSNLYAMKQYDAAIAASNEAKNWCIYGIVAAFVVNAILGVIYLIGGVAALSFLPGSGFLEGLS